MLCIASRNNRLRYNVHRVHHRCSIERHSVTVVWSSVLHQNVVLKHRTEKGEVLLPKSMIVAQTAWAARLRIFDRSGLLFLNIAMKDIIDVSVKQSSVPITYRVSYATATMASSWGWMFSSVIKSSKYVQSTLTLSLMSTAKFIRSVSHLCLHTPGRIVDWRRLPKLGQAFPHVDRSASPRCLAQDCVKQWS